MSETHYPDQKVRNDEINTKSSARIKKRKKKNLIDEKYIFKKKFQRLYIVLISDVNHATDIPVLAMLLALSARFLPIIIYCSTIVLHLYGLLLFRCLGRQGTVTQATAHFHLRNPRNSFRRYAKNPVRQSYKDIIIGTK